MKLFSRATQLLLLAQSLIVRVFGRSQSSRIIPGQFIVELLDDVDPKTVTGTSVPSRKVFRIYNNSVFKGFAASLSNKEVQALRQDPRVKSVDPNRTIPLDKLTAPAWLQQAKQADLSRPNVDIAIIHRGTTGISHPDLNIVTVHRR